jgi:predicted Zn-dependent protease
MTRADIQELLGKALSFSKAEETFITFTLQDSVTVPVAANRIQPSSSSADIVLQVSVKVGRKYATVSGNSADDEALKSLMARAVDHAASLPDSEDDLPFAEPVQVTESALSKATEAELTDAWRVDAAKQVIDQALTRGLLAHGKVVTTRSVTTLVNSRGLFLYQPATQVHVQARAMTRDGSSTGFSEMRSHSMAYVDPAWVGRSAADKCIAWQNPIVIKPERLTTILEANVLTEFLLPFLQQFDRQAIHESRSFLRKLDGTSFLGQKIFPEGFDVFSDPAHPAVPSYPFSLDGQRIEKQFWIRNGVVDSLMVSRAGARKTGQKAIPFPTNLLMSGGTDTLDAIIGGTQRGLLVSGIGSLTFEDPANCLLTGSTRDGLFLIEDGKISKGVQNLVLRESPVSFFKRMDKLGKPVPVHPRNMFFPMFLPAIRVPMVMYTRQSGVI